MNFIYKTAFFMKIDLWPFVVIANDCRGLYRFEPSSANDLWRFLADAKSQLTPYFQPDAFLNSKSSFPTASRCMLGVTWL